ncbi:helix-turn-helix domain-containing protein [Paenibacillus sp. EPM92]|uniref:helix-turn-helix domain-containing protein n=1 Tax=Paenibacillus sp. EPM92 TaxID=1561195 RepID=UPI001916B381|nr:helix-turn-helix domain-containing protein [Paenibacillus sp. EPM92]
MNDLTRYRLLAGAALPSSAKLLYSYLLDLAGGRTGTVWLSSRRLAAEVGVSSSAVRRNLHRLEQCGLIRLKSRYSAEGARLTNKITML